MKCKECNGDGSIQTQGGAAACPTCEGTGAETLKEKLGEIDSMTIPGSGAHEDDRLNGLYARYTVFRNDKRDRKPGDKHFACIHFVLDINHDPFALPALWAYAKACEEDYPVLSNDLKELVILGAAGQKCFSCDRKIGSVFNIYFNENGRLLCGICNREKEEAENKEK